MAGLAGAGAQAGGVKDRGEFLVFLGVGSLLIGIGAECLEYRSRGDGFVRVV